MGGVSSIIDIFTQKEKARQREEVTEDIERGWGGMDYIPYIAGAVLLAIVVLGLVLWKLRKDSG